jgi:hypothetical protein|tara:strand:- start:510 stop:668 length:159 start_codon:yes stop_codon:yes gene_type:complete
MKVEFAIIERFSTGPLLGFSYYPKFNNNDFEEINIYLILFAFHFKIYKDANT